MKHAIRGTTQPFVPISVGLVFESQRELDAFTLLVENSSSAADAVIEAAGTIRPADVTAETIDALFSPELFDDLIEAGGRTE